MQFRFPRLTPTVKKLLIVIAAAFVIVAMVEHLARFPLYELLALDLSRGPTVTWIWQPLTYWLATAPLPAEVYLLPITLLFVYFFLAPFEEAFGAKRTLQLSAIGVLASAAASILLALVLPARHPIDGPAAIALAAFGAFPILAGNREILFMFVIPMRVWTAIALGAAFSALLAMTAHDPFIFVEYTSALAAGAGFAKWITRPRSPKKHKPPSRRRGGPDLKVVRGGADDERPRWLN